jgi:hypothetical protein
MYGNELWGRQGAGMGEETSKDYHCNSDSVGTYLNDKIDYSEYGSDRGQEGEYSKDLCFDIRR